MPCHQWRLRQRGWRGCNVRTIVESLLHGHRDVGFRIGPLGLGLQRIGRRNQRVLFGPPQDQRSVRQREWCRHNLCTVFGALFSGNGIECVWIGTVLMDV